MWLGVLRSITGGISAGEQVSAGLGMDLAAALEQAARRHLAAGAPAAEAACPPGATAACTPFDLALFNGAAVFAVTSNLL